MKFLKSLAFAIVMASSMLVADMVQAAPVDDVRINRAEKRYVDALVNVSSTIYSANRYAVYALQDGYITGISYVYTGANAITSGSANIVAKVNGVSLTTPSLTIVSGTASLGTTSSTAPASTANRVRKGQAIELQPTGTPVMAGTTGGPGHVYVEISPNYTPSRFQQ